MKGLYYLNEHTQCKNYYSNERCFFYQRKMMRGQTKKLDFANDYCFLFLIKGKLEVTKKNAPVHKLKENFMYSLGYGLYAEVKATEDSHFFILTFDKPQILCDEFVLVALKKYLPKTQPPLAVLPMCDPILNFFNQIEFFIEKKMFCKHLYSLKQSEWFFLMRGFYTKKQNAMFFSDLVEGNDNFIFLVKKYADKVSTVVELAEACNMTTKTLTRRFRKDFNTTPKQWLLEQKKQYVKLQIQKSNNPKELYDKLGFSSYTHMNNFCVKQLGKNIQDLKS